MNSIDIIKEKLKLGHYKITQSRLAVATVLIKSYPKLLSPEEIFKKIQRLGRFSCDQVSVYRVLSTFLELELVKKGVFHGDAARYGLIDFGEKRKNQSHEHFFKCTECDEVESFSDCLISRKEKELEKNGYKNLKHHLEIEGICPRCS